MARSALRNPEEVTSKAPTPSSISDTATVILFDFDGTLTVAPFLPRLQRHAISDDEQLVASLTDAEVIACWGGAARLARLAAWLRRAWLGRCGKACWGPTPAGGHPRRTS